MHHITYALVSSGKIHPAGHQCTNRSYGKISFGTKTTRGDTAEIEE